MKRTTNKLVAIILMTSLNFLLFCQENTEKYAGNKSSIKITPLYESEISEDFEEPKPTKKTRAKAAYKPAEWVLESSLENAPKLIKGILAYLKASIGNGNSHSMTIPSCHRFILVGPPGSGKTTMAYAIAHALDCSVIFTGASTFLGRFRNETSHNIQEFFKKYAADNSRKVIIIDEFHKLFEHFENDKSDDSQSAATFWLVLDSIERYAPHIIVIATANNVDKLPPELKSRFSGKVITIPLPNKKHKISAFKNSIAHDRSVILDKSITNDFIEKMMQQVQDCSLRNVQLIIDSAKMFYYAENPTYKNNLPIILTKMHFHQAIDQLQEESHALEGSITDQICKKVDRWGSVFSAAANICVLTRTCSDITGIIISNLN